MLFVDFQFLPFFALVFSVHWALRSPRARKAWLLLSSYAFYAAWDWRFLSLILFSTLVDYVVGRRLATTRHRKGWLLVSLVSNLGLLGYFKYANFFLDSAISFLGALGLHPHAPSLEVLLPVGISFYTFQTLSYSIDVYRRRLEPERDLLDLALFVGFFPQLVAGPIIRAVDFLPQLKAPVRLERTDIRAAVVLFFVGFVKKAAISDSIAPHVDAYFAD
ncbi:MAG TPA: MBOAT family protein, partial [Planctomycetes bacterium]|nr:MBOAT family protein [Planctomycetota bacterium]